MTNLVTSELLRFAHYVEDHDDHAHPGTTESLREAPPSKPRCKLEAVAHCERLRWNDAATGVMRHADTAHEDAVDCAP